MSGPSEVAEATGAPGGKRGLIRAVLREIEISLPVCFAKASAAIPAASKLADAAAECDHRHPEHRSRAR